jgi:hypothetical protein
MHVIQFAELEAIGQLEVLNSPKRWMTAVPTMGNRIRYMVGRLPSQTITTLSANDSGHSA